MCLRSGTVEAPVSRLDVPHLERRGADDQKGEVEAEQNAQGLANPPPRNRLGEQELPDVQVIREKPMLQIAEVGNVLHDEVYKDERQREDRRGRRLHVETGKH